jgi:hypothetical protein
MFVQIIQGPLADVDRFHREAGRWSAELRPGAVGFLGATWGASPDGTGVLVGRFASAAEAAANADRPEQGAWWEAMAPAFEQVTFQDCETVDTMMGGGSDDARFVQVIEGRAKDQESARQVMREAEGELAENRPDILGGLVAWHGDDGEFTQVVYFRSEDEARAGEAGGADQRYQDMMATQPTFIDLPDPQFD